MQCTTFPEQCSDISNFVNVLYFSASTGKSSKENFLEDFNPNRDVTLDPNRWLAKGLFYEMMDLGLESLTKVHYNLIMLTDLQIISFIKHYKTM